MNTCPNCNCDTSWTTTSTEGLCVACLEEERDYWRDAFKRIEDNRISAEIARSYE